MSRHRVVESLPQHRFPVDPWRLVEREHDNRDLGVTETNFAVSNGYIGMRANPEEGWDAEIHGTFVNGFHETWPILHAEDAFGFATTGQTIVNVPDAKVMRLFVDDEPFVLEGADLEHYERTLDFRSGTLAREVVWRTPAGKRVQIRSTRLVSLVHRHLALMTFEVTLLDSSAPVVISSQMLNRQDGEEVSHDRAASLGRTDPRVRKPFQHRVLQPRLATGSGGDAILGYRCTNSRMTIACGYRHVVESACPHQVVTAVTADVAKTEIIAHPGPGETLRVVKFVAYHTSGGVPPEELADRCGRTLERAMVDGRAVIEESQREWLDEFWDTSDIELHGDPYAQQAMRWNLFQVAQATACAQEQGVSAKALTGLGYEGHYFWDTDTYILPFLAYTNPVAARSLLRFRWKMLPAARRRAKELNQRGALYPWRTINGEEASAYYAAGTAQYHINAAIAFAVRRYCNATGDVAYLAGEGADILVETARLWEDLGFYATNGNRAFRIHGVTGPDEYTTVVNDNLYTNVMARFNMHYAAQVVNFLAESGDGAYQSLRRRLDLDPTEVERWIAAADAMHLPYDHELGIHPQDDSFLEREVWDFAGTPDDHYPLLLYYHPLVIYRFQVLKQADVVLAMVLRGEEFTLEQKRRNFDYYDPITTGDSSLSACVQAVGAAQIGYDELAADYLLEALFVDLANIHGNTSDGVHVASAAGSWGAVVFGFLGLSDDGVAVGFNPNLPKRFTGATVRLCRHGTRLSVALDEDGCVVSVVSGDPLPLRVDDGVVEVAAGSSVRVPPARFVD